MTVHLKLISVFFFPFPISHFILIPDKNPPLAKWIISITQNAFKHQDTAKSLPRCQKHLFYLWICKERDATWKPKALLLQILIYAFSANPGWASDPLAKGSLTHC